MSGAVPGSTLGAIEIIYRGHVPIGGDSVAREDTRLSPEERSHATSELLEKLLAPEPSRGMEWWRLASLVAQSPLVVLRDRDWHSLLHRLLTELDLAFGASYVLRFVALGRLVAHPRAARVYLDLAADGLADNYRHVYGDLASGLRFVDLPEATALLIDQVVSPAGEAALCACLFTLAAHVRQAPLPPASSGPIASACAVLVLDERQSFRVRRAAAVLIRALQPQRAPGLAARVSASSSASGVAEVLQFGFVLSDWQRRLLMDHSAAHIRRDGYTVDATLRSVLSQAVGEADVELRGNALALLMLTPQGRSVRHAVTNVLIRANRQLGRAAAYECVTMLFWLAGPESVPAMLDVGEDESVPADLRRSVRYAVATGLDPSRPDLVARVRSLADAHYRSDPEDAPAADAFTYILGARGCWDELRRLKERAERDKRQAWITACASWLSTPSWTLPAD